MAPTPQESMFGHDGGAAAGAGVAEAGADAEVVAGDSIVISGMSGLYANARHISDLKEILYNKTNPISSTDSRWIFNHPEIPQYAGLAPDLQYFDAQFFKVHYKLANNMDVLCRKVLEQAHMALYDAGLSPQHLFGKKIGVYVGVCTSETEKVSYYRVNTYAGTGFGLLGCSKSMIANRISYWLNVKGPSIAVTQTCCGSTVALEMACHAIRRGDCEAALVAGAYLCLHPQSLVHQGRIFKLSSDDQTKSFDAKADGCVKAEALNVIFIQKAKDALRVYAEIVHIKSEFLSVHEDDSGPKFDLYRDPVKVAQFIREFYDEANVAPQAVEYVEACGSATPEVDKSELETLAKVFCKDRADPLLVGSVMSNIGYADAASGIAAVTKILLGYHTGELAGNLHYENPRRDITAVVDGSLRVVSDHTRFRREYTAVNGRSITGVNSHILLKGHYKPKDLSLYKSSIPHLVLVSGRQESAVNKVLSHLKSNPVDPEELALINNIHRTRVSGYLGRGYTVLSTNEKNETVRLAGKVDYFDHGKRPLWFVYSGMGSQYAGMGADLMRISAFAAAIERCHRVLQPKGINLLHIITSPDKTIFDNILHSFVGIAAVQIGLTDVLKELGLIPDKIIGHSVGELGCAYADGCFTAEEMILAAYSRGLVSVQTAFIRGAMAAVGLGYQQIQPMCPPEIEVACHNSSDSCTISGPEEDMRSFVTSLVSKGIFAKEVPCSNIAYHSRYIADAGPGLLKYLKEVIKTPKERSERWLSTSIPMDEWEDPKAKYSSAEYHTNNLLNPVLFEETSSLIPSGAILVEVAPHGLLQAILKRALPTCTNIPLTRREQTDKVIFLLEAIGKLYIEGINPNIQALYPKIEFPVSTETPMLSHLMEWVHTETWSLPLYLSESEVTAAASSIVVSTHEAGHKYLQGHVIGGKILYPFAATLVAVWDTLAMSLGATRKQLAVVFRTVMLHAQPVLHERRQLRLTVSLHRGNGRFEVMDDMNSTIASGFIHQLSEKKIIKEVIGSQCLEITSNEIYNHFSSDGFCYKDCFKSIHISNESLTEARIMWNDNWVTFIDGLIQFNNLRHSQNNSNCCSHPKFISEMIIEPEVQKKICDGIMTATFHETNQLTSCGGILIEDIKFHESSKSTAYLTGGALMLGLDATISDGVSRGEFMEPRHSASGMEGEETLQQLVGKLESLQWVQTRLPRTPGVTIKVHYAGLNVLDAKKAAGLLPFESSAEGYGMDFSGVTERGMGVMGLVDSGAVSSHVQAIPELLWPVPTHWSLEDAATVPLAYCLAYYCLAIKHSTHPGMSILVHGGAGAVGQAVLSLALASDCEVFTTVNSVKKKQFLLRQFPALKAERIGYSRDMSFSDLVLNGTNGTGVDLIISNVHGEPKDMSFKCVAHMGTIIDINQVPNRENFEYGMFNMTKSRSYISVNFTSIFNEEGKGTMKLLQRLVSDGIARGSVRPLSRVTYAPNDTARAFRLLAASNHRGRVLLRLSRNDDGLSVQSRVECSSEKLHVIISDEERLGLQLADLLVSRGARRLHLNLPVGPDDFKLKIRQWTDHGVQLSCNQDSDVFKLLNENTMTTIEGVYVIITNPQPADDSVSMVGKMDVMSRKMLSDLKYFVVVNTVNSVGEKTCIARNQDHLSGTMIKLNDLNEISARLAIGMVEKAVAVSAPLLTVGLNRDQLTLAEQVARLAGVIVTPEMTDIMTLSDLGMSERQANNVCVHLRDTCNIFLSIDEVQRLTLERLKYIDETLIKTDFSEEKGLRSLFTSVESDELIATTTMIFMSTQASTTLETNQVFDMSEPYIAIVPGVEGSHGRFRKLGEGLKVPALVLEPDLDRPAERAADAARRYAKILMKKFNKENKFYLVGYESGVFVVLEMAAILEANGFTGVVFCIGSPDGVKAEIREHLQGFNTEEALQDAILRHMFNLMTDSNGTADLELALQDATSWHEKLDVTVRMLLGRMSHSAGYARQLIVAAYTRIVELLRSDTQVRSLRSQVVLLQPASAAEPREQNMQRFSAQPVACHKLKAPLSQALDDLRCAAYINSHLDKDVLERFEQRNICITYPLSSTPGMSWFAE